MQTHILDSGRDPHLLKQWHAQLQQDSTAMMLVAGVDEAGRGPLVGSVVTAAVILPHQYNLPHLTDSKKLTEKKRTVLFEQIKQQCIAWCIAQATAEEIDTLNIFQATMLAMKRAVEGLPIAAQHALIDGNKCPKLNISSAAVVQGDVLHACISAASILAKVTRDKQLDLLHQQYPQYGFNAHKGYPTKAHLAAIAQYGVIDEHRRSYKPVKEAIIQSNVADKPTDSTIKSAKEKLTHIQLSEAILEQQQMDLF